MSEAFDSIKHGLLETLDHVQGKPTGVVVHHVEPVDVEAIRKKVGMSRGEFAGSMGVTPRTVRAWERGQRVPQGPALRLLRVMDRQPDVVLGALAGWTPA